MLKLKVITPSEVIVDELIDNVSIPTTAGMITVLNKHIPLLSSINHGEMTVRKDGASTSYAVHTGVVHVYPHHDEKPSEVVILLEDIEHMQAHDAGIREEALARAKALAQEKSDDISFTSFESLIERELSKVKFTKRK